MRAEIAISGRPGRPARRGLYVAAFLCLASASWAGVVKRPGSAAFDPPQTGPRTLAVLDPVDLSTNLPDPAAGRLLRRALAEDPAWRVLSGDSIGKQLRDLGMDPDLPCSEFQCAFDAGNALQSEFVLFGTATDLPEINAYTLGVAHIPTSQMVWSRVGQAPKRLVESRRGSRRGTILEGSLKFAVSDLTPASLDLRKRPTMGLLGVMDGGQSTPHSRVAMQRALAHAYASRSYDLLGPAELDALVAALDLDPVTGKARNSDATLASDGTGSAPSRGEGGSGLGSAGDESDEMLALGKQMGVRYLLRTEVRAEGREYAMDLSLYDVAKGQRIRQWPAKGTNDYAALLGLEDRFMTALGEDGPLPQRSASSGHGLRTFFKGTTLSLAAIGVGTLGYMAWRSHSTADQEYENFKAARTTQEADAARGRVVQNDTDARKFAILGGLTLAFGVAVWSF